MTGKICLVTGANSGIGKATTSGLARMGATVVMICRNREKGETVRAEIIAQSGNQSVDLMIADLASQQSIRQLATDFKRKYQQLHVLVNNAGGIFGRRVLTEDGLEQTFAVNHLAYFLLTSSLLELLQASAPSRIVNVTSEAQRAGIINFDDLQAENGYSAQRAYSQSKLANILFTYELARRLAGTGVTANVVHPGAVRTGFGSTASTSFRIVVKLLSPLMRNPEKGADTVVYLAASPEVEGVTGKYFSDRKERPSSKASYDLSTAMELWDVSEKLTEPAAS
jgi:NAD(P)-dependent dehydrogenase (short-subunit alcohol dehydrogenase family)